MREGQEHLPSLTRRDALYCLMTGSCGLALLQIVGKTVSAENLQKTGARTSKSPGNLAVDAIIGSFESMPLVTTKINDRMAMLSGPGGNMLVLTSAEGALIIDAPAN